MRLSHIDYANVPGAIIADGPLIVPLYAVTSLSLNESYHLPPLASAASRVMVETHDDTISLSGMLVGPERFTWKLWLELAAENAMRGSVLDKGTRGKVGGLILVTAMTIRTDIYVQSVSFSASATKRHVLDVSLTLVHLPRPGGLAKLLDVAGVAVGTLLDPLAEVT